MRDILIKPIITEKATKLSEKKAQYAFVVAKDSNKVQIKAAVEKMFGVNVKGVSTSITPGKLKNKFTKKGVIAGRKPSSKKAYVTLAAGESIDFYSL